MSIQFINHNGDFVLKDPGESNYLYSRKHGDMGRELVLEPHTIVSICCYR